MQAQRAISLLTDSDIPLLPLLEEAFRVRQQYFGRRVMIHIINNVQNGYCPEDCGYCAQGKKSTTPIEAYGMKSDEEILAEAKSAYERGAYRYCMVLSGRGPTPTKVERLSRLIRTIKAQYNLRICVSAGILDAPSAKALKDAGLDRYNHNLNTASDHYAKICSTHTYEDRLTTVRNAQNAGIEACSGVIVGLGESPREVVELATQFCELGVKSIPINFYIPVPGAPLAATPLTPEYCLRVLCVFRLLNPDAEIRVAAGRELHLRSMQVMAFYPANSLFLDGYLNVKGSHLQATLQMLRDGGFEIESEWSLDDLLQTETIPTEIPLKSAADLHPVS